MSEKAKRAKHREELLELQSMIEPARNDEVARRAIEIAWRYLEKAENQSIMLANIQRNQRVEVVRCEYCIYHTALGECTHKQWDSDEMTTFHVVDGDDFCSYGERKDKE